MALAPRRHEWFLQQNEHGPVLSRPCGRTLTDFREEMKCEKMAMKPKTTILISMATLVSGCAVNPPTPAKGEAREVSAETSVRSFAPNGQADRNPDRANIAISDDILTACGIPRADAYFAFDSANVDLRARTILGKVSECFSNGPLAKKSMRLVGHADPRGDEEYNLLLGGRRAESVRAVFVEFGLVGSRISTTSRGEMDATGTDEPSWSQDRRVNVLLGT